VLGSDKLVNNLFKDLVKVEDEEEEGERSQSSQSDPEEEENFYEKLSEDDAASPDHVPKVGGGVPGKGHGGIPRPS